MTERVLQRPPKPVRCIPDRIPEAMPRKGRVPLILQAVVMVTLLSQVALSPSSWLAFMSMICAVGLFVYWLIRYFEGRRR